MLEKLEDVFRSQQRFLSDASHELRTPLTVARGRLELLQEARPEGREAVASVVEELDRIGRIVENLLLLARLDEGMPVSIERVEAELVLREALLRGLVTDSSEATVEAEPGLCVYADPERLLQVMTTLVRNAVEHAGEGARLRLAAHRRGSEVILVVSDTGRGIPPQDLPHVFERFYRGSMERHRTPTGAGLGLAIAASLVEAMNGTIAVESKPGKGTTFTISLPRAQTLSAVAEAGSSAR
jgi:signal transduction histidine kinase